MNKNYFFKIALLLLTTNLFSQSVCQEQLVINNGVIGNSIGQSVFMSDCSGFFSSIQLNRSDGGTEMVTELMIFTGQTFLGTPRYTQTVTIPENTGPFTINFEGGTGDLAFFEESQYTFILSNPSLQLEASSDINSYVDGQMFTDVGFINNDDLWFKLETTSTLGLNNYEFKKPSVVPNPTNGRFRISGIIESEIFIIYNSLGSLVKNGIVSNNEEVNIENYNSGLYYIKLNNGVTLKLLKE